jgi:hypothetical protein
MHKVQDKHAHLKHDEHKGVCFNCFFARVVISHGQSLNVEFNEYGVVWLTACGMLLATLLMLLVLGPYHLYL